MTSQQLFKEFIFLFKTWPVDATKTRRCLGEYLRKEFNKSFKQGDLSDNIDVKYWSKVLSDLKPIANNEYFAKYPRQKAVGALGLGREQCKILVSNDFMQKPEEPEKKQ